MDFCVVETGPEDATGVKLLALSLARHQPDDRLHVVIHGMQLALLTWLADRENVHCHNDWQPSGTAWNIKPSTLLHLLGLGLEEVIRIDSVILITGNVGRYFVGLPPQTLVIAKEYFRRSKAGVLLRTRGYGLPEGCERPFTVNSDVSPNFHPSAVRVPT